MALPLGKHNDEISDHEISEFIMLSQALYVMPPP